MLRKHLPDNPVRTFNAPPTAQAMALCITPLNPTNRDPTVASETGDESLGIQFDTIVNDMGGDDDDDDASCYADLIDFDSDDDSDSDNSDDQNAHYDIRKEHLQAISLAEEAAAKAQHDSADIELLYCNDLDDVPDQINQAFSAVLGDPYHGMDRAKVPVQHEYKKAFKVALSWAWFQWDKKKLDEVTGIL